MTKGKVVTYPTRIARRSELVSGEFGLEKALSGSKVPIRDLVRQAIKEFCRRAKELDPPVVAIWSKVSEETGRGRLLTVISMEVDAKALHAIELEVGSMYPALTLNFRDARNGDLTQAQIEQVKQYWVPLGELVYENKTYRSKKAASL